MSSELPQQNKRYNFERIRTLFVEGFSDSELRNLCFDEPGFTSVYHQLAQNTGKTEIVERLLAYAEQTLQIDRLLVLAEKHNSARYTKYEPYYLDDTGKSPYRGLKYFDINHADLFFGRELLTAKLVACLSSFLNSSKDRERDGVDNFLAVVGASGSGKSSVVRAGLIPALGRGQPLTNGSVPPQGSTHWPVHIITPTAHPLEMLAASLTRDSETVTAITTLMDDMFKDPRSLHLHVRRRLTLLPDSEDDREEGQSSHLLLLVDQFEELFTLCRDDAERRAFIDNLLTAVAAETAGPTIIVITLRADFYHQCAQYDALREALAKHQEYIGPMTTAELRRAIELPAQRAGYEFESGLVDLLLRDVGNEPGALPLLSHALLETWQRRQGGMLTLEGYQEADGVRGAIAKTAETVYNRLTPEEQIIARRIFLAVTELGEGTQDTRRRAALYELMPRSEEKPAVEAVLKILADARLVTTSQNAAEVAHEALIREWPTLQQWLNENREALRLHRQLIEVTQEWDKNNRDSGYLYWGLRLQQVQEWAENYPDELGSLEREFLVASQAAVEVDEREQEAARQRELKQAQALAEAESRRAEGERQHVKRLRWLVAGLALVLLIATGAALFANAQQQRAEQQTRLASSRELAAAALNNLNVDPELSILLAIRALSEASTVEAEQALHRAAQASRLERTLQGPAAGIYDVAFSPDGQRLAVAGRDGTVRIWNLASEDTGGPLVLFQHEQAIVGLAFNLHGTRLTTVDINGLIQIWDPTSTTMQPLDTFSTDQHEVEDVAFNLDRTWLATASRDGTTKMVEIKTGKVLPAFQHESAVCGVTLSPDAAWLVTSDAEGAIRLWNVALRQLSHKFLHDETIENEACGVAFSPNGKLLVTAGNNKARIWDVNSFENPLFTLEEHTNTVWRVAFSADGQRLATVSFDGTAKVWDVASGHLLFTLARHHDWIRQAAFSPDGQHLATAGQDGLVKIWGVAAIYHQQQIIRVAYSPDGTRLITASGDRTVGIWDVSSQQRLSPPFRSSKGLVVDIAFNPDGKSLAVADLGKAVMVLDADTGQLSYSLPVDEQPIWSVAFNSDGKYLAAGQANGEVTVWNVGTRQILGVFPANEGGVFRVAFHPDGERLATAGADGVATLWNVKAKKRLRTFVHNGSNKGSNQVYDVTFSLDGARLATASGDKTARVWDVETGQELFRTPDQTKRVFGVAFSRDRTRLFTAGEDGAVKVWGLAKAVSGQPLNELLDLSESSEAVSGLSISPDGRRLVVNGADGMAHLYWLELADLLEFARTRVTRDLESEECQKYLHQPICPPQ